MGGKENGEVGIFCGGNPRTNLNPDQLLSLVRNLSQEVADLKSGLKRSETLREDLERKLVSVGGNNTKDLLRKVIGKDNTRIISGGGDERMGLFWDLESKREAFGLLDQHLDKLDHASRSRNEQPVAIISEEQLEMVSYPIEGSIRESVDEIREALCVQTDIMGHILVPKEEFEITAGFAGTKGNLIWFNTGGWSLILKLKTGRGTEALILDPGFGFCLRKREVATRVFLSSCDRAYDKFVEDELTDGRSHAIFFGCAMGDQGSWLGDLD